MIVFHVDLDAFYVAVETRENPQLRELPVVVGADPEQGKGRGVVVTCSYEARRFGLRSGMPISRAWKLCPVGIYLRPNNKLYERVSKEVMKTLRVFCDELEQNGIDEAFMDVSQRVRGIEEAKELALGVKKAVKTIHGLTCSIGVGPNKSTAKIASDLKKPDGLTVVPLNSPAEFLAPLPVSAIPGVGRKTRTFLRERRIGTIAELQAVPGKQLVRWFGKTGVWLWGVVHGEEGIPVRPRETPKSLSVERTFRNDVDDFGKVYAEVEDAAAELARRTRRAGFRFRVVGIKIRFHAFETFTREKTLLTYADSGVALQKVARALLKEFELRNEPVRLVGVRVSVLEPVEFRQSGSLDTWVG